MTTQLIATRPLNNNPADAYLSIVLRLNFKGEYVTHLYNSCDGGYHNGHYFGNDINKAMEDFKAR